MTTFDSEAPAKRRKILNDPLQQLRRMCEIRAVEDRIQQLFGEGEIRGSTHLSSGQEAVAVGIASSTQVDDIVTCTYRGHGHALALGLTPLQVIGEICGRVVGCSGGLGGSMHLGEPSVGLLPTFAIVGAGLPVACGAALAARSRGTDRVAVAIFGDGAANIGAFHESLNLASILKLPAVFVCENNLYGEYTAIKRTTPVDDIASRAASYGMPSAVVDGQDILSVAGAMAKAVLRARDGMGPTLLEMKTYRYSGHSKSDPATYRPEGELDRWLKRDPINLFADQLLADGTITADGLERLRDDVRDAVARAAIEALDSPEPSAEEMFAHVDGDGPGQKNRWNFWPESNPGPLAPQTGNG